MQRRTRERLKMISLLSLGTVLFLITLKIYIVKSSDMSVKINTEMRNPSDVHNVSGVDMTKIKTTDFKDIEINCDGNNKFLYKLASIKMDDLNGYFENKGNIKILGGGSFDYPSEMQESKSILIYSPGITDDEINNILKDYKITVTWQNLFGKKYEKIMHLNKMKSEVNSDKSIRDTINKTESPT